MHLADALIQSDLQYIQAIHFFCQPFALLMQCSTTEPQEHMVFQIEIQINNVLNPTLFLHKNWV